MGDVCESYYPSGTATQRFWDEHAKKAKASLEVPDGFPTSLVSTLAWTGDGIRDREPEWRMKLSAEDVAAIDAATTAFNGHVVNVKDNAPATMAPAFSDSPLSFHTDHCEVLSFYYQSMPSEGGRTVLSSSWQVYNELAASRPDLVHALTEPWVLDS
ncbi:hypothetical protein Neosp_007946 [[Neocosmospora] mangrovei]